MGFEDRQYFREDSIYGPNHGDGGTGLGRYSIIVILIAINVIVWICDAFAPQHFFALWFGLDTAAPWKVWTFLTYGFVHASIRDNLMHIVLNMFVLFMFGRPVAQRLGRYEFLRFFLVAIVASGLAFFLYHLATGGRSLCIGASGATTAILILFILWYPHQKLWLFGVIEMPAWALGVGVIVFDLFRALNPESGIAWQAHLGGAAFAWAYQSLGWNFAWMNALGGWLPKSKTGLSVYRPDGGATRDEALREAGDRILAKISQQGEESLTRKERKTLEKYSRLLREEK